MKSHLSFYCLLAIIGVFVLSANQALAAPQAPVDLTQTIDGLTPTAALTVTTLPTTTENGWQEFASSTKFLTLFLIFVVLVVALFLVVVLLRRRHRVYLVENNQGVAGVEVVLVNTRTLRTIETTTDAGGYFWAHLARGEYKIAIARANDLDAYKIVSIDYHDELKPVEGGYYFASTGSFENLNFGVK